MEKAAALGVAAIQHSNVTTHLQKNRQSNCVQHRQFEAGQPRHRLADCDSLSGIFAHSLDLSMEQDCRHRNATGGR